MTKCLGQNIITTLCGIDISKMKEGHNDDDDNDTNILNEAIEAPNDSDYHKL
jgi:carbamoylphosphate synthase small subunit